MPAKTTTKTPDVPAALTLRGPADLTALGPFIKARRRAAGFRSAKKAAPLLGVTSRLLREVERGERIKRGITLGKLLAVLQQLGYEVHLRPRRSPVVGTAELTTPPITVKPTRSAADSAGPGGQRSPKKKTSTASKRARGAEPA
jgi:hypothetical protein